MLAKKITYTDFNGEEKTETFYFNLTKAEIAEMELKHPGGYAEYIQRIIDAKSQSDIIDAFTTLILNSYGIKSEDGRHFRKSKEISEDFHTSEAYSVLFMEMLQDPDAASNFVNGIVPQVDLTEDQRKELMDRMQKRIESKKD